MQKFLSEKRGLSERRIDDDFAEDLFDVIVENSYSANHLLSLPKEILLLITNILDDNQRLFFSVANRYNYDFISENYLKTLYSNVLHFSKFMDENLISLEKGFNKFKELQSFPYGIVVKDTLSAMWPLIALGVSHYFFDITEYIWLQRILSAVVLLYVFACVVEIYYANRYLKEGNYPCRINSLNYLLSLFENNFLLDKFFTKEDIDNALPRILQALIRLDFHERNNFRQAITTADMSAYKAQNPKLLLLTQQQIDDYRIPSINEPRVTSLKLRH